jgi:hypothetical protein
MDATQTPTITTAAIFVALLFLDLFRHDFDMLAGHAFFGLLAVGGVAILCQNGAAMAAWGLLAFPFIILIFAWLFQGMNAKPYPTQAMQQIESTQEPTCKNCMRNQCRCPNRA